MNKHEVRAGPVLFYDFSRDDVGSGEVGAVFALEASRLARNNRDWHHLIDLCVLTRTLVIDADGIYDPAMRWPALG